MKITDATIIFSENGQISADQPDQIRNCNIQAGVEHECQYNEIVALLSQFAQALQSKQPNWHEELSGNRAYEQALIDSGALLQELVGKHLKKIRLNVTS